MNKGLDGGIKMINGEIRNVIHEDTELTTIIPDTKMPDIEMTDQEKLDISYFERNGSPVFDFMKTIFNSMMLDICNLMELDKIAGKGVTIMDMDEEELFIPDFAHQTATEISNRERARILRMYDNCFGSGSESFTDEEVNIYINLITTIMNGKIPESFPKFLSSFYFMDHLSKIADDKFFEKKKNENPEFGKICSTYIKDGFSYPFALLQSIVGYGNISLDWVRVLKERVIKEGKVMELLAGSGAFSEALKQVGGNILHTIDDNTWVEYHDNMRNFYDLSRKEDLPKDVKLYYQYKFQDFEDHTHTSYSKWKNLPYQRNVEEMDALNAIELYGKECDFIFISFIPMDDTGTLILKKMREVNPNCRLILLGEGDGGNCVSDEFFELAEDCVYTGEYSCKDFDIINTLHTTFAGYHDYITIYK